MPRFTFCLQTCGEETEAECLASINPGRHRLVLHENRDVTPIIRSLTTMVDRCETEYLVPLDSDMVLKPNFMDRIEKAVRDAENLPSRWHSILFPLWDTLTEEKIYALKVCKAEIFKKYPFVDSPCPDIQHYQTLKEAGYHAVDLHDQEPIGDHVVRGNYFCYARFRNLYMTHRANPRDVLACYYKGGGNIRERSKNHFDFLARKLRETGNEDYLHCIAGMVSALKSPLSYDGKDLSNKEIYFDASQAPEMFKEWYRKYQGQRVFL